jgi:glucan-binding YG repeat protein
MGNYAHISGEIVVAANSGMSTVEVVPQDPEADRLKIGSLYWLDVVATDIETVQEVELVLDLNNASSWELEGMELAEGFTSSYSVQADDNIATITITRTGENTQTGEAVIASLPARTWVSTITECEGYEDQTPEKLWSRGIIWHKSLIVEQDMGLITFVDDTTASFDSADLEVDTEIWFTYYSRKLVEGAVDYYAANTGWHTHTAEAMEDKDATCTESGYTGRTYCAECDSVVEWGTVAPATGHDYVETDGVLSCVCGQLFNGEQDGKTYIDGVVANGWIDNTYYYIDGVMVTGQYYMDGTMYTFGTDGVYQPNFMFTDFYETADGKLMYFVSNKPLTGYQSLMGKAYFFDAEGYGYEGEYVMAGETCLFENGQFASCSTANVINAGLAGNNATYAIYADGTFKLEGSGSTFGFDNHGTRPFIDYIGQIKTIQIGKDITRIATNFFAWTHVTKVEFSKVGKLNQLGTSAFLGCVYLREIELPATVTYMSTNAFGRCTNLKKVIVPASVTNISAKAFKDSANVTLYVLKDSYALNFAVTNKIPYVVYEPEIVKEIVEVDGVLYYVVDGVKTYGGLICLDGDYYYIRSNFQAVVNRTYWVTKTNDLLPEGNYTFGADGKMLNAPVVEPEDPDVPDVPVDPDVPGIPEAPGQIVNVNGVLYYRENGVNKYAGLIYKNGAVYYVRSSGQLVVGRTYWTTLTNDLMPAANYEFDAEGKMINPPIQLPGTNPDVPEEITAEIRRQAVEIFKILDCKSLSRVDFFLDKDSGDIIFNEINTLPGFTNISMFPMLAAEKIYS